MWELFKLLFTMVGALLIFILGLVAALKQVPLQVGLVLQYGSDTLTLESIRDLFTTHPDMARKVDASYTKWT